MKTQKFWLFLVGALLLVSAAASVLIFRGRAEASAARIYQDGECIRTIELDRVDAPFSFTVEWEGGYNLIEVERGRIRVAEADCPDPVCVRAGFPIAWCPSPACPTSWSSSWSPPPAAWTARRDRGTA